MIVILCGEKSEALKSNVPENSLQNAKFMNLSIPDLDQLKSSSVLQFWVVGCALDLLFDGKPEYVSEKMWDTLFAKLQNSGSLVITNIVDKIRKTKELEDFNAIIRQLANKWLLTSKHKNGYVFRKVETLNPAFVTPENLAIGIRNGERISSLFETQGGLMCEVMQNNDKNKIRLGKGVQGAVYFYPEWRSDVVVKRIITKIPFLPDKVPGFSPEDGKYVLESDYIEPFALALLNDLEYGHTIHLPRVTGFFSCISEKEDMYAFNIIMEKLDGDLKRWLNFENDGDKMKAMIWQCLYILIAFSRMGWEHFDSSPANFLVSKVNPDDLYEGAPIGSAKNWIYKLNGKSWKLKNCGYIAKLADFGFTYHFQDPIIKLDTSDVNYDPEKYLLTNIKTQGGDVGYFMMALAYTFNNNHELKFIMPLFEEWVDIIEAPKSANVMKEIDMFIRRQKSVFETVAFDTLRLRPDYAKKDPSALLDSPFFASVLSY